MNLRQQMDIPISTKAAILQALEEGESYGVAIVATVQRRTGGKLALWHGSVYPSLHGLERAGLIVGRTERAPGFGRPRRNYRLTPSGRKALKEIRRIVQGLFGLSEVAP